MENIWPAVVTGVFGLLCVILEIRGSRERKETAQRAEQRAEESQLSMELLAANCKLGRVTAKAVTHQHTNGDVEEAITAADEAQRKYDTFMRKFTSSELRS